MSSYCDVAAVDRLVQFITGSSQLPASGFSALSPLITFSPSPGYGKLPTAHTWYVSGYGKLPTAHTWYVSGYGKLPTAHTWYVSGYGKLATAHTWYKR